MVLSGPSLLFFLRSFILQTFHAKFENFNQVKQTLKTMTNGQFFNQSEATLSKKGNIANLKKCEQAISMHELDNVRNVLVLRKVPK